jgi:hypothetical protein
MKAFIVDVFATPHSGAPPATSRKSRLVAILVLGILLGRGSSELIAQHLFARWSFDDLAQSSTLEDVSKQADRIMGFYDRATGVDSGTIQLDGYTSFLERPVFKRDLPRQFTINAWLALESYPWFRSPVFDLRRAEKDGVILGVSHSGKLAVGLGQPDTWVEFEGPLLPLRQWLMLTLVVDSGQSARLYLNGKRVGECPSSPALAPTADHKLTIGRNAILEKWPDYQYTATNSFTFLDGRLDEVAVYDGALDTAEIRKLHDSRLPLPKVQSPSRILPSGPAGPAEFGAYYTRLRYTRQWERLWRVGDYPDILVRFARHKCRLVFWRGTSYVPCWVTDADIWYTNEWLETWGRDVVSCAEPLMDRECRFSNVRIIENSPARVIVHWRYALVDTEYTFVARDVDGKGEWADEYYIIYPDGIGIRKIDLFYSKPLRKHDWEESIILLSPGQHPDEVINDPEVTLVNMAGERHDYSWRNNLPVELKDPPKANIHIVNLKSEYRPFYIISPEPFESAEGRFGSPFFRSYSAAQASLRYRPKTVPSVYGWWNHWPVTPVPGDGRWVVNNDQPSHFNLTTFTQWKDYHMDERVKTRIMLHGMTNEKAQDLVPLARSWLQPPTLKVGQGEARYEPAERAYLVTGFGSQGLEATLLADPAHPAIRPALVLYGLRLEQPTVQIDGKPLVPGKDFQHGTVRELDQWKTVIWLDREFFQNARLGVSS